ncbi:uncharacterized protein LOC143084299 [Mytilus galloprovincialis]|uniref:uncharacterized protein LOC143084299 n=1 Tax=Mytilus galloprovincialis TaxID=29158 RepID=UPI003F7C755C
MADTNMTETESSLEQNLGEYSEDQTFNNKLLSGIVGIQQTLNSLIIKFENQNEEIHGIKNDIYAKDGRLQAVATETEDQTTMIAEFPDDMRENRKRLVQKQKEYKEVDVGTKIKGNSLFFIKSGSKYVEKVSTPKALAIFDASNKSKFGTFEQTSSNEVSDNGHTYCVTAAVTTTYGEFREAARQIMQGPVSACTYNTLVYRFTDKDGHTHDGYDDDRDYGIGSRILDYLKEIDAHNITIISSRTPPSGTAKIGSRKNNIILEGVKSALRKM